MTWPELLVDWNPSKGVTNLLKMVIVGQESFAGKIAENISSARFFPLEKRLFPDGEVCPRLVISDPSQLEGTHAIVALQLELGQCVNQYLVSLLWTLYNVKRYRPAILTCIMPYHLYSRQDTEFREGEPFSSRYLSEALEAAGIDNFMTVNSHSYGKTDLGYFFPKSRAIGLSAVSTLARALREHLDSPVDVICFSPDEGALQLAQEAAQGLGSPYYGAIKKERDRDTGVITQTFMGVGIPVEGHPVVIIDDLVSSGGTMMGAAELLREKGATDVYYLYTHPVHSSERFKRILESKPRMVFASDTIKTNFNGMTVVSVIPLLSDAIKRLPSA
ncbi:MAG: ribose-phosphate diphosphokinase [Candidatus Thorarchaeota archaeon]